MASTFSDRDGWIWHEADMTNEERKNALER